MDDRQFEQLLQEKGKTAPRVTPDLIQANIKSVHYFTALQGARMSVVDYMSEAVPGETEAPVPLDPTLGLLTFCVIVLQNGFTVTGESACASPENFDAEAGRIAARRQAENKIWPLMGYALKQQLHIEPKNHVERMQDEYAQLVDRLVKLEAFLGTETFKALSGLEQEDLNLQALQMTQYRNTLKARLDRAQA